MYKYQVDYRPSESFIFQGKQCELSKKKAEGYKVVSGGCGTYVLTRSSYMAITQIDSDGNIIRKYPKDFIREHYGVSRVSAKHLYQLKKDITNGIIKFDDIY